MEKILAGVGGLFLAALAGLVVLGAEPVNTNSYNPDPFLIEKVSILCIELPRGLFLLSVLLWSGGAVNLIVAGISDIGMVRAFAAQLRDGQTPAEILAAVIAEHEWADETQQLAARAIGAQTRYATTIRDIVRQTGQELAYVVLVYKLTADRIAATCELIRQACAKADVSPASLPDVRFPVIEVTSSPGFFAKLHQGDLIFAYEGQLVRSVDELQTQAAATAGCPAVTLSVLRYVQLTNHHPLAGGNEYQWQALHVTVKGGILEASLSDDGRELDDASTSETFELDASTDPTTEEPAASAPNRVTSEPHCAAAPGVANPTGVWLRFPCPMCGKSLKCVPEGAGRAVVCPPPPRSNGCGAKFRTPAPVRAERHEN